MSFYFSLVNSPGRFGNHFFRNLYWSLLAEKFNLKIQYTFEKEISDLGIQLYHGEKINKGRQKLEITDNNMMSILGMINVDEYELFSGEFYAQTRIFCFYLRDYFRLKNSFPKTPKIKGSVYIHLRLGDSVQYNPGYNYYIHVLERINTTSGYISSDSPYHPLCLEIKNKYPFLKWWQRNEIDTIKKAQECEILILSQGTFSWMMGFFSIDSDSIVYYPKIYEKWHGDIFVYNNWIEIDYKNI